MIGYDTTHSHLILDHVYLSPEQLLILIQDHDAIIKCALLFTGREKEGLKQFVELSCLNFKTRLHFHNNAGCALISKLIQ